MKNSRGKKIRVLTIISAPGMGGIENQLLLFLQRYDRRRFTVDVACGGSTDGTLRDRYLATGAQLIYCRWSRYVLGFVWRLFRLLRRERYDVVHAHLAEVSGAAILAARLAGVPARIASYDHTRTHWRNPGVLNRVVVGVLQRVTRRWATKIIGDAEVCLDVYYPDWREHPDQFAVCYDGIDVERFGGEVDREEVRRELGIPRDCLVVGHVGGFRKPKNHQIFVDVAQRVAQRLQNVHFLLVGDGELRPQIESQVVERGLSDRFTFAGNRDDVPRMLAAMDVFLMPSLDEGFGLAVAEAQLSGLAVVGSDIPGIREALSPSMCEFCRAPDDAEGLSERVTGLLEAPELRGRLGREGREYVARRFSIDGAVKKLEFIYQGLTIA